MKYSYLYGSVGKPLAYQTVPYKNKKFLIISIVLLLVFFIGTIVSQFTRNNYSVVEASPNNQTVQNNESAINETVESNGQVAEAEVDTNYTIDIGPWLATHKGDYSVAVFDGENKIVNHQSDKQFYMASIYKLYTAYVGYQKIDSGQWNENEVYVNGWTRGKCLTEMIRTSNNECGEKMASEIGYAFLQTKLKYYGLVNTSFDYDFVTTVDDASIILKRINEKIDLSEESTNKLIDSMKLQIHRDATPRGLGDNWQVSNKVGFRSADAIYHDVGIATNKDDKAIIFSIFSKDAGTNNLSNLASYIRENLK
jgi:beta-lactamase class A